MLAVQSEKLDRFIRSCETDGIDQTMAADIALSVLHDRLKCRLGSDGANQWLKSRLELLAAGGRL